MTARKRVGVGVIISGVLAVGLGIVFIGTDVTPDWVGIVMEAIGVIAGLLGIKVYKPKVDESSTG